ncbi:MAG: hypothetical protein ACQGVC_08310 [Myxococcota bacterium]
MIRLLLVCIPLLASLPASAEPAPGDAALEWIGGANARTTIASSEGVVFVDLFADY